MNNCRKATAARLRRIAAWLHPSAIDLVDLRSMKDGIVKVGEAEYWHRSLHIDDDRRKQAEFHTRLERERQIERASNVSNVTSVTNVAKIRSTKPSTFTPRDPGDAA